MSRSPISSPPARNAIVVRANLFGHWVDGFGLNETSRGTRAGRPVALKRRKHGSDALVRVANVFFALAGNPVRLWETRARWQQEEVANFRRLHPDRQAGAEGTDIVWAELVPGDDLVTLLQRGQLDAAAMQAAARELRRAHEVAGAWSHGDPHLGNVIYDAAEDRARLIDFEVHHLPGLPSADRHANDLLVLLQDLCGRTERATWLRLATDFLAEYADAAVLAALPAQLAAPRGWARLWWAIRTSYLPSRELRARLALLRESLAKRGAFLSSAAP